MTKKVVVVGGGQAGFSFAEQFRKLDAQASITMLCEEDFLPYQRPPLSKRYVKGELAAEKLLLRPQNWYQKKSIECMSGNRVKHIDTVGRRVGSEDGSGYSYDILALATGSAARRLPPAIGGQLDGVFTLRDIGDADVFASVIAKGGTLLVVGGGYIGLEAAAVAASAGMRVIVLELGERILQRVASVQTSDYFRELHVSSGVDIKENTGLNRLIENAGKVAQAEFSDGDTVDVNAVVVGIGITPNIQLAQDSAIAVDNGIAVNEYGETSVDGIYACGDCASFEWRGQRIRLESVQNATDQSRNAAINASGVRDATAYNPMPWFWSEQFDVTLQIAGLTSGYDTIVERDGVKPGSKAVFYFKQERCLGADIMNDPATYMSLKRVLEKGINVTQEQASDKSFNLKLLLA